MMGTAAKSDTVCPFLLWRISSLPVVEASVLLAILEVMGLKLAGSRFRPHSSREQLVKARPRGHLYFIVEVVLRSRGCRRAGGCG